MSELKLVLEKDGPIGWNQVIPKAELASFTRNYALAIAQNAPLTLRSAKANVEQLLRPPEQRDLAMLEKMIVDCFNSQNYQEGIKAFSEKRRSPVPGPLVGGKKSSMYKRVLVATGGSPWSDAAVSYAIAWAACRGAELRILSVLASPVAYTMPDVMSSSELLMASIERQGQELLDRVAAQAERAGVSYTTLLKWGNVPETILHTAAEEDCALIILGSRVVTGLKRLW